MMKTETIKIQNLKCHGCANTIITQLSKIDGVAEVKVNNDDHEVTLTYDKDEQLEVVINSLSSMGYPVEGETNKLSLKAKSYVSCAIGRMSK